MKKLGQIVHAANPQGSASLPSRWLARELPAERDAAGMPVRFDRTCDRAIPDRLVRFRSLEGTPTELRRALTADERAAIEGRKAALTDALSPYSNDERDAVEAEVAAMFSGFRSMRAQDDNMIATIEVTCAVLREFPLWAIAKGCKMIATRKAVIDGRRLDERYAPNDAEVHAVVEGEVKTYRRALNEASAILDAPVALPDPVRITRREIEAKLARTIEPQSIGDDYMARTMADLERRRLAREAQAASSG